MNLYSWCLVVLSWAVLLVIRRVCVAVLEARGLIDGHGVDAGIAALRQSELDAAERWRGENPRRAIAHEGAARYWDELSVSGARREFRKITREAYL